LSQAGSGCIRAGTMCRAYHAPLGPRINGTKSRKEEALGGMGAGAGHAPQIQVHMTGGVLSFAG